MRLLLKVACSGLQAIGADGKTCGVGGHAVGARVCLCAAVRAVSRGGEYAQGA